MKAIGSFALLMGIAATGPIEASQNGQTIPHELNNLTGSFTVTAYAPWDSIYDGLKVNNFKVFQARVSQYCPHETSNPYLCPNGTDMVFSETLHPMCLVPGGQDMYVAANGGMYTTAPHSHTFPQGAWPEYFGWSWDPYPTNQRGPENCPMDNPEYNCEAPTGVWNFRVPNATMGGVVACPEGPIEPDELETTRLYAITPDFDRTDCVALAGLGTHEYSGPSPPVWAYA